MTNVDTTTLILQNLYTFEEYSRSVLPHLKEEYFHDAEEKNIFNAISAYVDQYNTLPSKDVILIELDGTRGVTEDTIEHFSDNFTNDPSAEDKSWLFDKTEEFCQNMALHNALIESVSIAQGNSSEISKTGIPDLLKDALSVSFDTNIGHDYMADFEERWEFYNREEEKIAFSLEAFNHITNMGMPKKTVMILLGGTGTGKSLVMTHLATDFMVAGKNVLYITLEMSEEKIEERIDSNLLDFDIGTLRGIDKKKYLDRAAEKRKESFGNIITKEYPTAGANVSHFRYLLNELRLKKNYVPDIIFIDYLNICNSSRIKGAAAANTYVTVKAIAEEIRGLAVEFNVPIITATQTNRDGYRSSDLELTDISESFGSAATADYVVGLIVTDELDLVNQIGLKTVKNRYGTVGDYYPVNIEKSKMRLFDCNVQKTIQPPAAAFQTEKKSSFKTEKMGGFQI